MCHVIIKSAFMKLDDTQSPKGKIYTSVTITLMQKISAIFYFNSVLQPVMFFTNWITWMGRWCQILPFPLPPLFFALRPFLLRLRRSRCHSCWRWFCAMSSARLARTDRLQRRRGCIPGTHLYIKNNTKCKTHLISKNIPF